MSIFCQNIFIWNEKGGFCLTNVTETSDKIAYLYFNEST